MEVTETEEATVVEGEAMEVEEVVTAVVGEAMEEEEEGTFRGHKGSRHPGWVHLLVKGYVRLFTV